MYVQKADFELRGKLMVQFGWDDWKAALLILLEKVEEQDHEIKLLKHKLTQCPTIKP